MPHLSLRLLTRTRLLAGASLLAIALSASNHAAYAGTPEEAEAIRAALEKTLNNIVTPQMSENLTASGNLTVVDQGSSYLATFPAYTVTDDNNATMAIPSPTMTLTPNGTPNRFNFSVTLPSELTQISALNEAQMKFSLGTQSYTGVYDIALSSVLSIDMKFTDIKAEDAKLNSKFEISSLTGKTDLTEDAPGIFSGPGKFTLSNASFTNDAGVKIFELKSVDADSSVTGMDIASYMKVAETIRASSAKEGMADEKAMMKTVYDVLSTLPGPVLKGMQGTVSLNGLTYSDPTDGTKGSLDSAAYKFSLGAMDSNSGTLGFGVSFAGLAVSPMPEDEAEMLPSSGEISLSFAKIPVKQISAAVMQALLEGQTKDSYEVESNLQKALQSAVETAGVELTIEKMNLNAPLGSAQATGSGVVDATAAMKATGKLNAVLVGLKEAIDKMTAKSKALEGKDDQESMENKSNIDSMLGGLTMIMMMGAEAPDANGKSVRTYNFEVGKDGQPKLNGAPLGGLMGMGGAPGEDSAPSDEAMPTEEPSEQPAPSAE